VFIAIQCRFKTAPATVILQRRVQWIFTGYQWHRRLTIRYHTVKFNRVTSWCSTLAQLT